MFAISFHLRSDATWWVLLTDLTHEKTEIQCSYLGRECLIEERYGVGEIDK